MLPCYRLLSLGSSYFPFFFPNKMLSRSVSRRSRWPRVSRHVSATAALMLGLRVQIPPGTWMSVSYEYRVLSGKGFCTFLPVGLYDRKHLVFERQPPVSSDLSSLDFYLWERLNTVQYSDPIVHEHFTNAF